MKKWNDAKGWSFQPNRSFGKRFWRVMDHHEWEHVEQVVDGYIDQAQTPLYLLKVLETPERYTQIELDAEEKRCREEVLDHSLGEAVDTSRTNPFLSGSTKQKQSEPLRLGDAVSSLPSTRDGSTT